MRTTSSARVSSLYASEVFAPRSSKHGGHFSEGVSLFMTLKSDLGGSVTSFDKNI